MPAVSAALAATAAGFLLAAGGCATSAPETPGTERASSVPERRGAGTHEVRGIYDRDLSATGFDDLARIGFTFIDSGAYREAIDPLEDRGLKAFVWLGGYSNETCKFNETDDWVRTRVARIADSRAVGAYFIDDEPDAEKCPSAPAQMKARSELVKSLDPGPPTFLVTYHIDQIRLFAGTVDVLGLDKYPCNVALDGCDYSVIDEQAAEADRLGVRYWGVIQAFGDDYYKVPTPGELRQQFTHWRATNMEGYLVFAWRWPDDDPSLWLANHPELRRVLAEENAR